MVNHDVPRIVITGGRVAGLEACLALRAFLPEAELRIDLLSRDRRFETGRAIRLDPLLPLRGAGLRWLLAVPRADRTGRRSASRDCELTLGGRRHDAVVSRDGPRDLSPHRRHRRRLPALTARAPRARGGLARRAPCSAGRPTRRCAAAGPAGRRAAGRGGRSGPGRHAEPALFRVRDRREPRRRDRGRLVDVGLGPERGWLSGWSVGVGSRGGRVRVAAGPPRAAQVGEVNTGAIDAVP
jgi:hypothetical protein